MKRCPQCGARADEPEARFCAECSSPLADDAPDSPADRRQTDGLPASSGPVASAPDTAGQQADQTAASGAKEDGAAAYVREVQRCLSDGVLDARDEAALAEVRVGAGLSAQQAAELERAAKDAWTSGAEPCPTAPVVLEINDAHFYMEKLAGVLDFRLRNQTDAPLERVTLSVAGKWLGQEEGHIGHVAAGQTCRRPLPIRPELAGEHLVEITLKYRQGGIVRTWTAHTLFKVLRQNESLANLTLNIDQSMRMTGEKIGFGQSIRNEVQQGLISGLIQNVNDLLQRSFTPAWQTVPLVAHDAARGVRLAFELLGRSPWLDHAALLLESGGSSRRLLVRTQAAVALGRNRKSDIVLRRYPRGSENDEATRLIQGHAAHCLLQLTDEGLTLRDCQTANGTWLDGVRVHDVVPVRLDRPSEIDVAQALRLRLTPLRDAAREPADDAGRRYRRLGAPDDVWQTSQRVGLRGVLLERLDQVAAEECYVIVYRWVDWPADLPGADAARTTAGATLRLLRIGGRLWGEVRGEEPTVDAGGLVLESGSVFPITRDLVLSAGTWRGVFTPFVQYGLGAKEREAGGER